MTARRVVLLTGAGGFLAPYVAAALAADEWHVRGITRQPDLQSSVAELVVGDPFDPQTISAALRGVDVVVHLAARAHVMNDRASDSVGAYQRVNVDGTALLLKAAAGAGVRHLVFISSVKVMGEANTTPWRESDVPRPVDAYGRSKLAAEALATAWGAVDGRSATVLRLPLVYGSGMKANMLALFRWIDRGWPLPFAGLENRRSLLYAGNAAAAVAVAVRRPVESAATFLLSDGHDLSTPELIEAIARALGRPARLVPGAVTLFALADRLAHRFPRVRSIRRLHAAGARLAGSLAVDNSAFAAATGFTPPCTLAAALDDVARWYRLRHPR